MMRALRRAAIASVSLAATSCLLFVDLGAYDAVDADAADAAGDSGSISDARNDSPIDTTDASDASDAAAVGCKTSDAAFCADFDDGILVGRWTYIDPSTGGRTVEISNAVSKSPSSSLHSVIDREVINPAPGDCIYARPRRDLADLGARTRARFSFDVWLGAADGPVITKRVLVASLQTDKDCAFIIGLDDLSCGAIFQFPRNGTRIEENVGAGLPVPFGKTWVHVDLDVSFDPSAPAWSLSVNGQRCGAEKVMPPECQSAQTMTIGPGLYCEAKGTGLAEIYIDNVEVR